MHGEIRIGDSIVMMSDEFSEWGGKGAETIGGSPVSSLEDPFGHNWSVAQHLEDVSPEEMERRREAVFAGGN